MKKVEVLQEKSEVLQEKSEVLAKNQKIIRVECGCGNIIPIKLEGCCDGGAEQ